MGLYNVQILAVFRLDITYSPTEIRAESPEEALKIAKDNFEDMDLTPMFSDFSCEVWEEREYNDATVTDNDTGEETEFDEVQLRDIA